MKTIEVSDCCLCRGRNVGGDQVNVCNLDEEERELADQGEPIPPAWCPLREGPITIKLMEVK